MPNVQSIKENAVRKLVYGRAAGVIDLLAAQVLQKVPATQTFTRDELVALLQGVSERMWEEV